MRRLVEVFDAFPLRAKKARDFAVWRQAVLVAAAHRQSHGWAGMASLAERLREVRKFVSEPHPERVETPPELSEAVSGQIRLLQEPDPSC